MRIDQQEKFNKAMKKGWQAATILDAMSKARLDQMDGTDISIAIEGVRNILYSALYELDDLTTGGKDE
ncbi:hypothetical protein CFY87_06065 [Actinobacillus seminis]|uniref:Uncharacterized protein n=1 Tax=Actinobacillus seminis TaxID=722 RepID=A0A263HBR1_9PAST|nr:hypothetical protein [Actinobacillus seminis]OZN24894.1 hypothetical protein CFY87_06065 [Actinobacillus seminis]SUU36603.1 Uncharacterised protein [Actinobacillus seminis]